SQPGGHRIDALVRLPGPRCHPRRTDQRGRPHLGPVLQPVAADRLKLNAALAELLKYSLVRRDATTHTLTIHRLVQAVITDELDDDAQRQRAARAVQSVDQGVPSEEAPPSTR